MFYWSSNTRTSTKFRCRRPQLDCTFPLLPSVSIWVRLSSLFMKVFYGRPLGQSWPETMCMKYERLQFLSGSLAIPLPHCLIFTLADFGYLYLYKRAFSGHKWSRILVTVFAQAEIWSPVCLHPLVNGYILCISVCAIVHKNVQLE